MKVRVDRCCERKWTNLDVDCWRIKLIGRVEVSVRKRVRMRFEKIEKMW